MVCWGGECSEIYNGRWFPIFVKKHHHKIILCVFYAYLFMNVIAQEKVHKEAAPTAESIILGECWVLCGCSKALELCRRPYPCITCVMKN